MNKSAFVYIAIMSLVTMFLRFSPFVIFSGKKTPKYIEFLGEVLPFSIVAMLIVYCLKFINVLEGNRGIPEFIAIICVVLLHIWKKNTILSVCLGTLFYMYLVQVIFV